MAISVLTEHLKARPLQLLEAKQNGQKIVGYFPGNYVPEEIIFAAGAVPLCLIHGGSASAAAAGLAAVPQIICPFARSLIGEKLSGQNPYYAAMDMLVAPMTCQHLKKVAEIWEYEQGLDIFKLGVPFQHSHEFELAYFTQRINALLVKMQALTGNTITQKKLLEAIVLYNRMRDLLKKISLLRRSPSPVISAEDFIALNHGSYYADPRFMVELLESEYQDLCDRQTETVSEAPRILLLGPNLGYGDNKILQLVEAAAGRIVIEEFCEGMRHYWQPIDTRGELIPSLARGI